MASLCPITRLDVISSKVCRTCLVRDDGIEERFSKHIEYEVLKSMIAEVTNIKLCLEDGLPCDICDECVVKAESALNFKTKSHESDSTLRSVYSTPPESLEDCNIQDEVDRDRVKLELCHQIDNDSLFGKDLLNSIGDDFSQLVDISLNKSEQPNLVLDPKYGCEICNKVVRTEEEHSEHVFKCIKVDCGDNKNNIAYCPLCSITFPDNTQLTKHMWDKHADIMGPKKRGRPKKLETSIILKKLTQHGYNIKEIDTTKIECTICRKMHQSKSKHLQHLRNHQNTKAFSCEVCNNVYLKNDVHQCRGNPENCHIETNGDEYPRTCLLTETTLKCIMEPGNDLEKLSLIQACFVCSAVYTTIEALLIHNDNVHPELSHRCNVCMKTFSSVKNAARHRENCNSTELKFACPACDQRFGFEVSLNKHILRHHFGYKVSVRFLDVKYKHIDRQFSCRSCNRSFSRQDLLEKHAQSHLPDAKQHECPICSKKFYRPDGLRVHMQIHDPNHNTARANKSSLCLYCGRSFSNSSNLLVHMRRHTGEKPYKCDFCSKAFPRSSDLQCHRRMHTGEKPCVCAVCGKAFSRSNKLSRHMRVHTGQKPYKCTYCDKAFSQSNDLKLHIRRHTGDKPYVCEICGERFIQGTVLQNHRRTHGHYTCTVTSDQMPSTSVQMPLDDNIENTEGF